MKYKVEMLKTTQNAWVDAVQGFGGKQAKWDLEGAEAVAKRLREEDSNTYRVVPLEAITGIITNNHGIVPEVNYLLGDYND